GAMTGKIVYADGAITLEGLRGDGLALDGSVQLPEDGSAAAFDVAGRLSLAHPLVALAAAGLPLRSLRGQVSIERASGSFPSGGGAPQGLILSGTIADAGFLLDAGQGIKVSGLRGSFATDSGKVTSELAATTDTLGAVSWKGTYDTA